MSLKRLPVAAGLALAAALLAHQAGFGTSHEMGGTHGSPLAAVALGALALLSITGILWVAFANHRDRNAAVLALRTFLPARGHFAAFASVVTLGAALVFGTSELLEGRDLAGYEWALVALPLAGLLVALLARAIVRFLAVVGVALATLADELRLAARAFSAPLRETRPLAFSAYQLAAQRGRAPPRFA